MPMPTAPFGVARWGLAAVLLLSPGSMPRAAQAESSAPPASSPAAPGLRSEVASLLARPEAFPPFERDWKPLGPGALGVLEELAANPRTPSPQRARAVTSMAAVDHPQASERLRSLMRDSRAQPTLRASAATALGLRVGTEAVSTLLPLLEDRDEDVRAAVARALGRLGGTQVQQALEERLPLEEDPLVREAIQQGLTFVEP